MRCKICKDKLESLGTIPFDRNNMGVPVVVNTPTEYFKCIGCHSVSCPSMQDMSPEELGKLVYNEEYIKYDPDYLDIRPKNYADFISSFFHKKINFRHLDYGSGQGIMGNILKTKGWDSTSYDPYSNNIKPEGKYDLITAIEVFEHSADLDATIEDIKQYMNRNAVILFSTRLSDKNTDINWWYIGARNGHISIQSAQSMKMLAIKHEFFFSSINEGVHLLQTTRNDFKNLQDGLVYGR